jgi:hypothetical protein
VQLRTAGQTFNGNDFSSLQIGCRNDAGIYGQIIKKHGTAAAVTGTATELRSGQTDLFTQRLQECG